MKKLAIVRGKFLNQYEMQSFAPLVSSYDITAFGSSYPYHDRFPFPVVKCASPMDLPEFPYKMPLLNRLFIDAHYLLGLEKKLKGFDIVHTAETYYRYTQQCLNAKKWGYVKKVVATVLENIPFNNEGIWGRKACKKRSRNELDHIIALTEKTKDALIREGADPKKITVIGHGIDTETFSPAKDHFTKLKREDGNLTILFSGRLETYKGVYDLLDAMRLLIGKNRNMQLKLIFVGNGSELNNLKKLEKHYELTPFITHKTVDYADIPELYREADIVALPSISTPTWEEQYCTALLEAQSMGLPIVTTRSGGIPENAGDSALYVPEHDAVTLAGALQKFIESGDMRVRYGKKARERALRVHDAKIIAKKLDRVYQNLFV